MDHVEHLLRRRPRESAISLDFDDDPSGLDYSATPDRQDAATAPPTLSSQWRSVLVAPADSSLTAPTGGPLQVQRDRRRPAAEAPTARMACSNRVGGAATGPGAASAKIGVARLVRVRAEDRSWLIAAAGEERTADRLDRLAVVDPRWRFLHAIRRGGRVPDVDHLAIGPGGVFVITSRYHPRATVWVRGNVLVVDGESLPHVRAARHVAHQAAAALSAAACDDVSVAALVALVDARELTVASAPPDVSVLHQRALVRWLLRQPETLDGATVDRLDEIARRPSIWGRAQSWR